MNSEGGFGGGGGCFLWRTSNMTEVENNATPGLSPSLSNC